MSKHQLKPSDSLSAATSPRSSVPPQTQPSRLRRAVTAIAAATAMAAAACGPVVNADVYEDNACQTAEKKSNLKLTFNEFRMESEELGDAVKGTRITLDCDVSGITQEIKDSCGGPLELVILGDVTEDGGSTYPGFEIASQPITSNGQQFLSGSLKNDVPGRSLIYVKDTEVRIRDQNGKVLFAVKVDPKTAQL